MSLNKVHEKPDVYNIKIPLPKNPLRDLNVYVVVSEGEALFIDTGFRKEECRKPLLEGIEKLGIPWDHISLFITHMHSDHAGQIDLFTNHGCPAYMNAADFSWLKRALNGTGISLISERLLKNGFPQKELDEANKMNPMYTYAPAADLKLNPVTDGSLIKVGRISARVIQTSGHTPGHSCLYLEDYGILFSGDHILYDITPNICMWTDVADSLGDYIYNLIKIDKLPFSTAYPAHRELHDDPHGRIREILHHHKERLNEVQELVAEQPGNTCYEIGSRMKWSIRCKGWYDFPVTQKWFAIAETLAHLDWLVLRQYVRCEEKDGVLRLYPIDNRKLEMENMVAKL